MLQQKLPEELEGSKKTELKTWENERDAPPPPLTIIVVMLTSSDANKIKVVQESRCGLN